MRASRLLTRAALAALFLLVLPASDAFAQGLSSARSVTVARGAARLRNALALSRVQGATALEQSALLQHPDVVAFLHENPGGIQSALTFDTLSIWQAAGHELSQPVAASNRLTAGCSAGIGRTALASICGTLADAVRKAPFGSPGHRVPGHPGAVGPPPVAPDAQQRTLARVLERVGTVTQETGRPAVVQIDLDLTAMKPVRRSYLALQEVGAEFGIPEFLTPESLVVLPPYHAAGFHEFLARTGIGQTHPDKPWDDIILAFGDKTWAGDWTTDFVTPGLADFVSRVEAEGGIVVFNTARDDALRAATENAFRNSGIENPVILMRPDPNMPGGEHKAQAHELIRELVGEPVALFDDVGENLGALSQIDDDVLTVRVALQAFANEVPLSRLSGVELAVSTFELP